MFNAAMIRAATFLIAILAVGCGTHQSALPPKVVTIGSLTDAARRLELLGYSHDDDLHVLGQHFVNYKRETPDAIFKVSIVRWEDDQRIKDVFFHCQTNSAAFDTEARKKILLQLDKDVCALIDGRDDYFRAQRDSQKIEDNGLARFEGRATTAEGWQIDFTEYTGYYVRDKGETGSKLTLAQVALSHIATKEDMTSAAIIEFNRVMNQGKTETD